MNIFSVVIITLNEEDNIGKCIDSALRVTNDIVIVDSGSTDRTIDIAISKGARVCSVDWMGYSKTKNYGVKKTLNNWIVSLDADEILSEELIQELNVLKPKEGTIYQINRLSSFLGKWVRHSGWHPEWNKRIYHKNQFHWNNAEVHESLIGLDTYTTKKVGGILLHYSYTSEDDVINKSEKYAKLLAMELIKKDKKPNALKRLFGAKFKFINTFVFRLGFLDGVAGYRVSLMNSRVVAMKLKYYDSLKNT